MASEDEIAMKKETPKAKPAAKPEGEGFIDATERAKIMSWGKRVLDTDRDGVIAWLKANYGIKGGKEITVDIANDIKKSFAIMRAAGAKEAKVVMEGVTYDD
jgi:hypothetical protein